LERTGYKDNGSRIRWMESSVLSPLCRRQRAIPSVLEAAETKDMNLSPRQQAIYDTVLASSRSGIQAKKLVASIFDSNTPKNWGALRVHIFEINRKLKEHGQRIKGRRDAGYVLLNDKGDTDG
jgi:DNA-binding response OmpR family regulator